MLKQFAQKVDEMRRLIDDSRSASFLLAVSGGMDSMCLLDLFSKFLQPSEFAVAHCNFSLRGEESDGDQALVEARTAELGVRLFVKRFNTESFACEKGISIEMAARDLRYSWFDQLCREHGFDVLAVAHNANDNAETLILNLLRGTGLNGLHGMTESTPFRFDQSLSPSESSLCPSEPSHCHPERSEGSVTLFRPLLQYTRKQIEGYVLAHHVPYRHDSSNFSSDYKRNKIRNEVFPVFEKINPSFVRTLNREIGYFSEAGSIVEDWCRLQLPNVLLTDIQSEGWKSLPGRPAAFQSDCSSLAVSLPKLLETEHWRYLLYYILEPYGFNSQTLASIESLLTSDRTIPGKRFESLTHTLLTTQNALIVFPSENPLTSVSSCGSKGINVNNRLADAVMVVRGPGIYNFNGRQFKVEIVDRTTDMPLKQPTGVLALDAAKLKFPFVCRRWRHGDWFVPLGMRGRKKVSDIFTDLKYNALDKDAAIIIADTVTEGLAEQQHIAGLLGVRIDDRYRITPSTTVVVRIL